MTAARGLPAGSLSRVAGLGAALGHVVEVSASGPEAESAVEQLRALALEGFGDLPGPAPSMPASVQASAPAPAPLTQAVGPLPASPGAASGEIVFTSDEAEGLAAKGHKVILVRVETSPEDIAGMHAAQGILTTRGGMTSHAAVVARGWGKCCVVGAGALQIDAQGRRLTIGGKSYGPNDILSIDGSSG